jgi:pSer/pThr/pTyr-binding forkhead associated (FHA) protein
LSEEIQITKEKVTMGRKNCDIFPNDPEVSRQHCTIECFHETPIVKDLANDNDTMLNNQINKEDFLKDQDGLKVGNTVLLFFRRPMV